jgi:hypothetical protein
MRIPLGSLNTMVIKSPPVANGGPDQVDESSSERNKFGRPYPWYCGVIGWSGLNSECDPPTGAQIEQEFQDWYRDGVASGKLDPAVTEEAYNATIKALEADIQRNEKENTMPFNPLDFKTPLYLIGGALLFLGIVAVVKSER